VTRKWIVLIFFTVITVISWIGIETVLNLLDHEIDEDYYGYLEYLSPQIDDEIINEIKHREEETLYI